MARAAFFLVLGLCCRVCGLWLVSSLEVSAAERLAAFAGCWSLVSASLCVSWLSGWSVFWWQVAGGWWVCVSRLLVSRSRVSIYKSLARIVLKLGVSLERNREQTQEPRTDLWRLAGGWWRVAPGGRQADLSFRAFFVGSKIRSSRSPCSLPLLISCARANAPKNAKKRANAEHRELDRKIRTWRRYLLAFLVPLRR